MTKRMLIDASHAEETRVVVLDGTRLEEFDLEAANRLPLKGNIYLAKVVRVEPSLQAAFVEYGGNRHGFLPLAEIHPDYYQIPVADRQRLLEMQAAAAREEEAAEEKEASEREAAAEAEAASDAGSGAGSSVHAAEPSREEPEPVLVSAPQVESAAEAAQAPASDPPPLEPAPEEAPATSVPQTPVLPENEPPPTPDAQPTVDPTSLAEQS